MTLLLDLKDLSLKHFKNYEIITEIIFLFDID